MDSKLAYILGAVIFCAVCRAYSRWQVFWWYAPDDGGHGKDSASADSGDNAAKSPAGNGPGRRSLI